MKNAVGIWLVWALSMLLWPAGLARADEVSERELLRQQQLQIEARYQQAMRDCAGRFQVTDCELDAKARRRAELAPVLKRQQALDLALRQQQVQEQRERVKIRQLSREQEARSRAEPTRAASAGSATPTGPSLSAGRPAKPRPKTAGKAQAEQAARMASQAAAATRLRIQEAQQHEREVLAREADLRAKGKRAAPLPMPGVAAPSQAASATKR